MYSSIQDHGAHGVLLKSAPNLAMVEVKLK